MSEKPDGADGNAESPSDDAVDPVAQQPTGRSSLRKRRSTPDGTPRTAPDGADDEAVETAESDPETEEDSDTGEREGALVGASAGSARAAARRSAAGRAAAVSPTKGASTRSRTAATTEKLSVWARLMRFFREVVSELRKTIWPARNQMVTYTVVVIVFVVFMVALVAGLDVLFSWGVLKIFG